MATRYVWLGHGASLLNSQVYNRIPKGFSLTPDEKGPPFRKMIDYDAWQPRVFSFVPDDPSVADYTPIPTKSQHRIVEAIKVPHYVDNFGVPVLEESKNWFRRLFGLFDEVVYVTTDVDPLEPYIIYYRSKWVDD